jgi:hypothetical protein
MTLFRVSDYRLPKASHFGVTVTVKHSDVKQIKRRIALEAPKSPKRRLNIDDAKSLEPLIDPKSGKPLIIVDDEGRSEAAKTQRIVRKGISTSNSIDESVADYPSKEVFCGLFCQRFSCSGGKA